MAHKNHKAKNRKVRRKDRKQMARREQGRLEKEQQLRKPQSTTSGSKNRPLVATMFLDEVYIFNDCISPSDKGPPGVVGEVLEVWRCPKCHGLIGIDQKFLEDVEDRVLCPMCDNWIQLPPEDDESKETNGQSAGVKRDLGAKQSEARGGPGNRTDQPQVRRECG